MSICDEIQQKIADLTFNQTLQDPDILQHIETCQDCQDYQQTYVEMNQAMNDMSNYDADDALVESTLNSIISLQDDEPKPRPLLNSQWASVLAASFMLVSLIALFPYNSTSEYGINPTNPTNQINKYSQDYRNISESLDKDISIEGTINEKEVVEPIKARKKQKQLGLMFKTTSSNSSLDYNLQEQKREMPNLTGDEKQNRQIVKHKPVKSIFTENDDEVVLDRVIIADSQIKGIKISKDEKKPRSGSLVFGSSSDSSDFFYSGKLDQAHKSIALNNINGGFRDRSALKKDVKPKPKSIGTQPAFTKRDMPIITSSISTFQRSEFANGADNFSPKPMEEEILPNKKPLNAARLYLDKINSLNNLTFQNASGYWANTYLPGDSHMRLLETSLKNNNIVDVTNSIDQNIQPFDHPNNSALSIYLNSDAPMVQQPTRMRLQVGIQASNRQAGHRQALNIGLVFDLGNKTSEHTTSIKALLLALLKSKQPGDRISLTIAGVAGGLLIKPKDFRHGPIQVALNTLFTKKTTKETTKGQALTLQQALATATAQLQINDDSLSHLGSNVLILFSANNIDNISEVESLAHVNAINGITLSTVSLAQNNQAELTKLALAGQGHTRILQSANDAQRIIDSELLSSSRAVARAIRLRIRLAKGVKLIKVIDSHNLNHKQAQRVRDAEQSLDQHLSKNLGITMDRGNDDEGIQIVIPAFFAGDSHVILLDIVVSKAGTIADVSMRYKDLLYLRNALTRKQLTLSNRTKMPGPLQLNVMKNVLASHFANGIKQAGQKVRKEQSEKALAILLAMQKLYQSMRAQHPLWSNDIEMLKDEKLLQQYINLLNSAAIQGAQQINYIADSMQYISWRKNTTKTH